MSHLYIKQSWVHYPTFVLQGFLQGLTSMTTNLNQQLNMYPTEMCTLKYFSYYQWYLQNHYLYIQQVNHLLNWSTKFHNLLYLKYTSIIFPTFQCEILGFSTNLEIKLTAYMLSGWVVVRYMRLPTSLLLLQQIFSHPMKLSWMAFPFPYANLKSPFLPSRDKKTYFSTYTLPINYKTSAYTGCSNTTYVHRVWCSKLKIMSSFPCHFMRSMILDLLYTVNSLTHPFSSIWRL
jgi:hypothetical protein